MPTLRDAGVDVVVAAQEGLAPARRRRVALKVAVASPEFTAACARGQRGRTAG